MRVISLFLFSFSFICNSYSQSKPLGYDTYYWKHVISKRVDTVVVPYYSTDSFHLKKIITYQKGTEKDEYGPMEVLFPLCKMEYVIPRKGKIIGYDTIPGQSLEGHQHFYMILIPRYAQF